MCFSSTVLPQPEPPTMATISPRLMRRFTPSSTGLPSRVETPEVVAVVAMAIGGSTNGLVHLAALAGRLGIEIDMAEFDRMGRDVPTLIDLKPSGAHYMEHFHWAGGVPKLMKELGDLIDGTALTVTGEPLSASIARAEEAPNQTIIRTRANPLQASGAMAVLSGNLAPQGALIKQSAASPSLMQHEGRAVVFESVEDMTLRMDDPDLDVTA
ncbi:MAG: dihydroxy-acid dehydratase, partial [Planctomycetes bacterium]|nr:dihydroxy-acid dehydratase [Planctomycetota bacterium]